MARWLVPVLFFVTGTQAQQLNLTLRPVTDGTVTSIREIHTGNRRVDPQAPAALQPAGLPSDLDTGPLVGSVVSRPIGGAPGDNKWQFGAAGTPDMRARLGQTGYEVIVTMDDGERRVYTPREPGRFHIGQRVTARSGELEPS